MVNFSVKTLTIAKRDVHILKACFTHYTTTYHMKSDSVLLTSPSS